MASTAGPSRRRGKEEPRERDGEDAKKGGDGARAPRKAANPNSSPARERMRREVMDGAFEKLLANLAALVLVAGALWVLIKMRVL
ncbi:hypothetical protein KFE25_013211 [Diacronema lutheri]|uniref:Uncharacterized protein n=1 Tax=Diacronema lutheri TaxID=2081491 RepID=A0A8J5X871_DIALT|nr:hypothetical protein KFE25_013211 [Diacronema lutheri]